MKQLNPFFEKIEKNLQRMAKREKQSAFYTKKQSYYKQNIHIYIKDLKKERKRAITKYKVNK